jgi:hypothetical protein
MSLKGAGLSLSLSNAGDERKMRDFDNGDEISLEIWAEQKKV